MDSYEQIATEIEKFTTSCIDTIKRRVKRNSGIYEEDFLYFSAMNRTIEVAHGFKDAVQTQNLSVMPVLLRVQINTLATVCFIESSDRKHEIIRQFNEGVEFRKMKVLEGKKALKEHELIAKAEQTYPWIQSVYSNTSSWVHLSPTSTYAPLQLAADRKVTFRVPRIPDARYKPVVDELYLCMCASLEGIYSHIEVWASTDLNPPTLKGNLKMS